MKSSGSREVWGGSTEQNLLGPRLEMRAPHVKTRNPRRRTNQNYSLHGTLYLGMS